MDKLRRKPIECLIFIMLVVITTQSIISLRAVQGTPADIGTLVLLPYTVSMGLLALFVLTRILKPDHQTLPKNQRKITTTPFRASAIIAAVIASAAVTFFAYWLFGMLSYDLGNGSHSSIPLMLYLYPIVPLVFAIAVLIACIKSLRGK